MATHTTKWAGMEDAVFELSEGTDEVGLYSVEWSVNVGMGLLDNGTGVESAGEIVPWKREVQM